MSEQQDKFQRLSPERLSQIEKHYNDLAEWRERFGNSRSQQSEAWLSDLWQHYQAVEQELAELRQANYDLKRQLADRNQYVDTLLEIKEQTQIITLEEYGIKLRLKQELAEARARIAELEKREACEKCGHSRQFHYGGQTRCFYDAGICRCAKFEPEKIRDWDKLADS